MTVADIVAKRRARWDERHDIDYDDKLVNAAAIKILQTDDLRREILDKPYLLIECCFQIVDKKKKTVPFFLNEVQKDFIRQLETHGTERPYFILKGRQQGFTTLITAIQLSYAIVRKNFAGFTMADSTDKTLAIFNDKAKVVYERLPDVLKPSTKFNSKNELFFNKMNSSWRVATATDQVGRSWTLNFAHFSEVAFYECDLSNLQAGIGEALTAGAFIVYETTANGFNQAKDLWDQESCNNLFYGWWLTDEYRHKDLSVLDNLSEAWIIARVKVLREMGLEEEQIAWYVNKYNGYIKRELIRQEYPITPEEAFLSTGECVFDKDAIYNRLVLLKGKTPGKRGYFTYRKVAVPLYDSFGNVIDNDWDIQDIEFIEDSGGYVTLHTMPEVKYNSMGDVIAKAPYVLGGDTAGTGEDFYAAKVINAMTDKTVATLHKQHIAEDLYAEQLYCLGKLYHDALISVEINYSQEPMRLIYQRYNYRNVFVRRRLSGMADETVRDVGFETTRKTKPIIIGDLIEIMRRVPDAECDVATLKEMLTFVESERERYAAIVGCHDDLVMALAIAHNAKSQQRLTWIECGGERDTFIEDNFVFTASGTTEKYISWEDI